MAWSPFPKPPDNLCGICKKAIVPGDLMYGLPDKDGRKRHWECHKANDPFTQLRKSLDSLRQKIKDK